MLDQALFQQFGIHFDTPDEDTLDGLNRDGLAEMISEKAHAAYDAQEQSIGAQDFRNIERMVMLQTLDTQWKDHLLSMDHLKEGIGLRGYAQQNPLIVYKKEGFDLFSEMIEWMKEETLGILYRIEVARPEDIEALEAPKEQEMSFSGGGDAARPRPKRNRFNAVPRKWAAMTHAPVVAARSIKNVTAGKSIKRLGTAKEGSKGNPYPFRIRCL